MTEWRAAPLFEGTYEVSSDGQVRRISGGRGARSGTVLRPKRSPNGYLHISLRRPGFRLDTTLHRLVCHAFHGPRPAANYTVAHWNGVRTDCRASNLRWATQVENCADKRRHGTYLTGERVWNAKLTTNQVRELRNARAAGQTLRSLTERFGISYGQASRIANRHDWRQVA